MAQTTGALSWRNSKVEISSNGSDWTDISGFENAIEGAEQARMTGEAYTSDGDTAVITAGKREPMELTCTFLYTEGGSDPFEVVRALFEAGTKMYMRWSPLGGASTTFMYTTPAAFISNFVYPQGEAGSADPVPGGFTLKVPSITKSVVS